MRCRACHELMISRSRQTLEDDDGALAVTTWWCKACHEVGEEIWVKGSYRGVRPARMQYAVGAPVRAQIRPTRPVRGHRGRQFHALLG